MIKLVFPYGMTAREFNFCKKYLETGFDFDAAIDYAYNYSYNTKRIRGYELFKRPGIQAYLKEHIKIIMDNTDLSAGEVIKEIGDILKDPKVKTTDRLKAGELLLKHFHAEKTYSPPTVPKKDQGLLGNLSEQELREQYLKMNRTNLPEPQKIEDKNVEDLYEQEQETEDTDGVEV